MPLCVCLNLDVAFFSESLDKYSSEHEQAVGILEQRPIGMILVDCKKLKEVLIPSPLKCLEVSKLAYNVLIIMACDIGNKKWQRDLCTVS